MNKRPVYSNDRTAPRMKKGAFSTNIVTKKLWRSFVKEYPEYKNLEWSEFFSKWLDIAQTIREESITNPLGVKLGGFCGELKLQYLPYKFEGVDNKATEEVGQKMNYLKLTNNGKMGKIKWERRWAVKFNKMLQYFAFDETRELNRLAKVHVDNHPEKLRVARNTLGGHSIWRNLKLKK